MRSYIMALDSGTSSCRCVIFDKSGAVAGFAQREFPQYYPKPGWVEHDPEEIFSAQLESAQEAMLRAGAVCSDIAAIGITNQRETTIVWDKTSGRPVCPAIVWQCRRTAEYCEALERSGYSAELRSRTGLVADAYFSATKLKWILDNVTGVRERAERGELLFGTVDSWLVWRLTGGTAHVTDVSNASRTMLFNIHRMDWDDEILREFDIPRPLLPRAVQSSEAVGETLPEFFGGPIPICGIAGDQQAALFGQRCFNLGDAKNTYGTGCFLLMNTGGTPVESHNGLIATVAWKLGGRVEYALEGSVFIAGAGVQWLRDELGMIKSASETCGLAESVPDTAGCCFVPAFTGLGAPYWDPYARGTLVGLTRGVGRAHIVRAVLEAIAYQTNDVLRAMEQDVQAALPSESALSVLRVDGGASANRFLMSFQAGISDIPVERPACVETTALGAAYLAGLACGFWLGRDSLPANPPEIFLPAMSRDVRAKLLGDWSRAVERSRGWAE